MKQPKIKYAILYSLLIAIWSVLVVSLFMGCNVYEHKDVEIIRCPQIQDTVQISDWDAHILDVSDFFSRLLDRKVPASVFVTMNPQMQAVRIAVRENGRQSFEDYVREQVAAGSRSSVVPDHTLLHLTFPDSKAIPSRRGTTNEYFYGKLAPAFIRQDIHLEPAVSLRDAAFALSKGLSPLSPAERREQLMRDPGRVAARVFGMEQPDTSFQSDIPSFREHPRISVADTKTVGMTFIAFCAVSEVVADIG